MQYNTFLSTQNCQFIFRKLFGGGKEAVQFSWRLHEDRTQGPRQDLGFPLAYMFREKLLLYSVIVDGVVFTRGPWCQISEHDVLTCHSQWCQDPKALSQHISSETTHLQPCIVFLCARFGETMTYGPWLMTLTLIKQHSHLISFHKLRDLLQQGNNWQWASLPLIPLMHGTSVIGHHT